MKLLQKELEKIKHEAYFSVAFFPLGASEKEIIDFYFSILYDE